MRWVFLLILCTAATCQAQQQRTYTLDADFDTGVMINVNHDVVHDQLQLDHESIALPFVNVAASKRGTIIRIDANTGDIIGEYRSAPQGELHNPSRTTVDREGNVWAANRDQPLTSNASGEGSIVKIGIVIGGTRCDKNGAADPGGAYLKPPFSYSTAVDRDGDGLIRTSRGLGDIHTWTGINDISTANDECILMYKKLPAHHCRHLSIDADNNVWAGGYSRHDPLKSTMMKLKASTGELLELFEDLSCGGYGGLVSQNGTIFSSSMNGGGGPLLMLSPTGSATCISFVLGYGLAEGIDGNIWTTTFNDGELFKLSPTGGLLPGFPIEVEGTWPRGVAVTQKDGHVWIACSGSNTVERRDTTGALLKVFDFAAHSPAGILPTGIAVDANGNVWVTNARSDNVFRIDPEAGADNLGSIDMEVFLGIDAYPYNYSDMTGAALGENIPRHGSWTVVNDGGSDDVQWQRISWSEELQEDAEIVVRARAANTRAELPAQTYTQMVNGELECDGLVKGRFIEVRVEFLRGNSEDNNPILYDLTIDGSDLPSVDGDAFIFCEGDSVRISADPRFQNVRWNDGSFALSRWITAKGTYWYTGISPLGCMVASDTVHIDTRPPPHPIILPDTVTICRGEQGTLTATPGYLWYSWSPLSVGDSSNTVRVSQPGSYTVTVIDSLGCIGTSDPVVVRFHPLTNIALVPEGDTVLCQGQQMLLRATPGFSEYRWSTGLVGNVDSLLVTSAGLYTVSVTDSNGCNIRSNAVGVEFAPAVSFDLWVDGVPVICEGDSAIIRATPGFRHYHWSTGTEGSSDSLAVTRSGWYFVTVLDEYGCSATSDSLWIEVLPPPVVELRVDGDSVFCEPGTTRLRATSGFEQYTWSSGEVTTQPWIDVDASGVYRVTVTGEDGCPGTSNPVTVVVRPRPVVDLWMDGGFVLCRETEGKLQATPGYALYRWSTGEEGPESSILVSDSGRYWVSVESIHGCIGSSDTVNVRISNRLLPEIARGSDTLCDGSSLRLDAGPGYATYTWNTGEMTRFINISHPGLYSVHVTTALGCEGDTSIVIYAEPLPVITTENERLCPGGRLRLDAGPGFASYRWSTGDTTQVTEVLVPGPYIVTVRSTRGCEMSDTIMVEHYARPAIDVDGRMTVCRGSTEQYQITDPPSRSTTWQLASGGRIIGTDTTDVVVIEWETEGTYELSMTIVDENTGCRYDSILHVTVELAQAPPIEGETFICRGSTTVLHAASGSGTLEWVRPDDTRFMGDSLFTSTAGIYTLLYTSAAGCSDTATVEVLVQDAPSMQIAGAREFCAGDSTTLTAMGNYRSCIWQTPFGSMNGPRLVINRPGVYILESVAENGCIAYDTADVIEHPLPLPVITGDTEIVPGDSTLLQLSQSYASMTWTVPGGGQISGTRSIMARDSGRYSVRVVTVAGCEGTTAVTVRFADVQAAATIALPHLEAAPGERIFVPLRLQSAVGLDLIGVTAWSAELRYDHRVMSPIGETPLGWIEGDERIIPLLVPWNIGDETLAQLEFLTTLGPVSDTELRLSSLDWDRGPVSTTVLDGSLRLEICQEGGDRLFDASGQLRLEQNHPNPFNTETVVEFELIEAGHTEVLVFSMLGRCVTVLARGYHSPGAYRVTFDAAALPSGSYICVLRTPTETRQRRMHLLK